MAARGRITQNWPFTLLEYWQRTVRPNPDDDELVGTARGETDRT